MIDCTIGSIWGAALRQTNAVSCLHFYVEPSVLLMNTVVSKDWNHFLYGVQLSRGAVADVRSGQSQGEYDNLRERKLLCLLIALFSFKEFIIQRITQSRFLFFGSL